jgi:hypothetical protein
MNTVRLVTLITVSLLGSAYARGQESYADLVEQIEPSVVHVQVFGSGGQLIARGTGFFISEDTVVTNKHVVEGAKRVTVRFLSGLELTCKSVTRNPNVDLAILEVIVANRSIPALRRATKAPRVGERVIAVGNPLGLSGTVTDGIVSSLRSSQNNKYIQITAPISPGSSGSPVVNMSGEVVGVATLTLEGGQNLNFAISTEELADVWPFAPTTRQTNAAGNSASESPGSRSRESLDQFVKGMDEIIFPPLPGGWLFGYHADTGTAYYNPEKIHDIGFGQAEFWMKYIITDKASVYKSIHPRLPYWVKPESLSYHLAQLTLDCRSSSLAYMATFTLDDHERVIDDFRIPGPVKLQPADEVVLPMIAKVCTYVKK